VRGYTVAEIRAAERPLLDAGVPLMRLAATALAGHLTELLQTRGSRVVVLAGSGDNGGDALYAAAALGPVRDVVAARVGTHVHEAAWTAAVASGVREVMPDEVAALLDGDTILVDGMRGIGGAGAGLRGVARETALAILPLLDGDDRPTVVAVDVPSGIDADTGAADDAVLPADLTVTFGAMKAGLLREPARTLAGRVVVVDIGLGLHGA
jgi:hydroxyethylthiazole kinase-like uncharacterized protein yjeF